MLDFVLYRLSSARRRLILAATLGSAALVALPVAASAQQIAPTDAAYSSTIDLLSRGGDAPGSSAGAEPSSLPFSSLPFTGLDVALLVAVAAGLVLAGFVLRRYRKTELDVR